MCKENNEQMLDESNVDEYNLRKEEYQKKIITLCNELDKRPCVDGTDAIHRMIKKWNLK